MALSSHLCSVCSGVAQVVSRVVGCRPEDLNLQLWQVQLQPLQAQSHFPCSNAARGAREMQAQTSPWACQR